MALSPTLVYADKFYDKFLNFRRHFIIPKMADRRMGRPRIKIAILDTGFFVDDQWLSGQISDVMKYRKTQNFQELDEIYPIKELWPSLELVEDGDGHGTRLAYLFLKYAPDADLYIAKVSDTTIFKNTNPVVEAIKWAVEKDVDIISMSFGSSSRLMAIGEALALAQGGKERPLIFASASNNGLNENRAYPARDSRVLCVHALDGNGDRGPINITRGEGEYNYGTLGRGIKLSFKGEAECRSGASYATPILAAFTANLIDWLGHHAASDESMLNEVQYNYLKSTPGIRHIFQNDLFPKNGTLRYITPWHLFKSEGLTWTEEDGKEGMSESKREGIERRDKDLLGNITHTMETIVPSPSVNESTPESLFYA